ncbi:TlpA family protein disulfide reductase [Sabulilitoribacter arenilitoris]|uniref:TlpA family protein disulfide reductase n=1 Tax=Wocania arenilitoris TaxID=2044858 RepID=A0AAE3JLR4_9FLAO|nr:TlpA disulfide reductase family protein [Wocania arenilitoris]MCF7568584.1 TlpA family protein disulfide reductase [Wocania arenilitoris]
MKKLFILCCVFVMAIACKEEPKDYVTLSGIITDKNSDSLVVKNRTYSKAIQVSEDGSFKDTLKVETGLYLLYDGNESTLVFLKNGFDLKVTIDTKAFGESVKYTGTGSEHSNFLAEKALLQEKLLNVDVLSKLNMAGLEAEIDDIKDELTKFYNSNPQIDSSIINKGKNEIDPMLNFYKRYLSKSIALKEELPKGSPSPIFKNYENIDGTTTSLSDLKGKYVYIDVWATWCGPCIAEIPYLKALEKEYHNKNIQFVSLSIDDGRGYKAGTKEESFARAKEGWKKMIAEKELGGIQILAPNGWQSQFVQDYKIKGIPRFLLIDPNGNIVTPDAPRPSSASIKELFVELSI